MRKYDWTLSDFIADASEYGWRIRDVRMVDGKPKMTLISESEEVLICFNAENFSGETEIVISRGHKAIVIDSAKNIEFNVKSIGIRTDSEEDF